MDDDASAPAATSGAPARPDLRARRHQLTHQEIHAALDLFEQQGMRATAVPCPTPTPSSPRAVA